MRVCVSTCCNVTAEGLVDCFDVDNMRTHVGGRGLAALPSKYLELKCFCRSSLARPDQEVAKKQAHNT